MWQVWGILLQTKSSYACLLRFSSLRHRWPWPILAILFRPFVLLPPKTSKIIPFSKVSTLSVLNEGYSLSGLNEGFSLSVLNEGYSLSVLNEGYSLSVLNEGYSRNALCALNSVSTFLLKKIIKQTKTEKSW